MSTPITVYGDVDERAVSQLRRCADAGDALRGALCADGHVGYSQPIGGAVAYADHISPSGVGYDIACLAAGTPVTTADGYWRPIEAVDAGENVLGWDTGRLRVVSPCEGALPRGERSLRRVTLALGRELRLTDDHRVRTRLGWKRADELLEGDAVACAPFVGLRHEPAETPPALLRLLAYCAGDGHLGIDGKTLAWYTNSREDAHDLAADLASLGVAGRLSERRKRGQHVLTSRSVDLHARFAALGCPVGKKVYAWPARPFEWLFALPAWQRAVFLAAFMSAEGSTPSLAPGAGYVAALAVKQSGVTEAPIRFVQRLFASLGFTVNVTPSGPPHADGRQSYVAQLQGGEAEILRYLREIGFNRCVAKRRASAAMLSVAAQREAALAIRATAIAQARHLRAVGVGGVRDIKATLRARFGVPEAVIHHGLYGRGTPRVAKRWRCEPDHSGEVAWLPVLANEPTAEVVPVFDVVTGDAAACFLADGVVVHNCGNKAARTNLRADEIRADLGGIMDSIFSRISFGVGRNNDEPVDHAVLDQIKRADFAPQRQLYDLAAKQLGTVGAGNHYVDLFEDEDGWVWIGVHFGSRGFGHKTASGFLALAQGLKFEEHAKEGEMDSPPVLFRTDSDLCQSYVSAIQLAGEYAYAGRDTVVSKVLEILGAEPTYEVHNHHNFCIAGDQVVPTPGGPKRMDELVEGDEVYAYSESGPVPTRVAAAWASGDKPIYRISLGSRRVRCSGSHPIMVLQSGSPTWRNAEDLVVGDIVVCADGYYPRSESWGPDRARLVGAFLGDGWIRHDHVERCGYTLGLAIGTGTEPHTQRYATLAAGVLPNTGWGHGWRVDMPGHFGLSCSSKSAWTTAVEMGLGERADVKRVPHEAFALSCEEKLALLGGYFDADGSIAGPGTSNHGRGCIASVSKRLVQDLRELAVACGLQVTPISTERRVTNYGACVVHRCTIAAASMAQVPLWHQNKAANQRHNVTRRSRGLTSQYLAGARLPDGFFARRVKGIEVGAPEPVFDLTVEHDSHSFIVEGVVTHNCWRERHFDTDVWVIRKGCTPAFPGQEGFVGATMGEPSVILRGSDSDASRELLYSTVHGAGRVMSRTKAAGKMGTRAECSNRDCDHSVPWKQRDSERCPRHPDARWMKRRGIDKPGLIDFTQVRRELIGKGIELRGGAADEAPGAYKRLDKVLAAHGDTIEIVHRLTPLGVAMAGADTFDPYKD